MNLSPSAPIWRAGLFVALAALSFSLFSDFASPWTDQIDANGACWSQSAHNTLRAGLRATAGVPSAFYFGTLPIPPEGYYAHHPPLLSLALSAMFFAFGEREWVARSLPIAFSLWSVVLLWQLVRRCANRRTAAFSVLAFAAMPMELRYGRMVNFEPVDLAWMLGALLALFLWRRTGRGGWWLLAVAMMVLAMWTAWLGYLFVVIVCAALLFSRVRGERRLAWLCLAAGAVSLLLWLLAVHRVQPDAWAEMVSAVNVRMARTGVPISWQDWWPRMRWILATHIQPIFWLLGLAGIAVVWKSPALAARRWLAWAASAFLLMSGLYVVAFRNASSIHDYASFYFAIPVAIFAALALDGLNDWGGRSGPVMGAASLICTLILLAYLLISGARETRSLARPFLILTSERPEPPGLIPGLGRVIRDSFGPDVAVICNFLPDYGPQLHYYAGHELLPCAFTAQDWRDLIGDPENAPIGGVIWLGPGDSASILEALPPGTRDYTTICGVPFCIWKPAERAAPPGPNQTERRGTGGG